MYVLDTNVVSELRKAQAGKGDANVTRWIASQPPAGLYLSAITVMELQIGVLRMDRRDPMQGALLGAWMQTRVLPAFAGRVLPVDQVVALRCAQLHADTPRAERDALIAATALVHSMGVATRNTVDFETTGVQLVNPWTREDKAT